MVSYYKTTINTKKKQALRDMSVSLQKLTFSLFTALKHTAATVCLTHTRFVDHSTSHVSHRDTHSKLWKLTSHYNAAGCFIPCGSATALMYMCRILRVCHSFIDIEQRSDHRNSVKWILCFSDHATFHLITLGQKPWQSASNDTRFTLDNISTLHFCYNEMYTRLWGRGMQ